MPMRLDVEQVRIALHAGSELMTGLVTKDRVFALVVFEGAVHVIHTPSGMRLSTAMGFGTLDEALEFIAKARDVRAWSFTESRITLTEQEVTDLVAIYRLITG